MNIDFYFDPSCPFCWVTSRFVLLASNKREININWKLFSLAIKNGELDTEKKTGFDHMPAHRVERVLLAASKQGANLGDMYKIFGIKHFLSGEEYTDDVILDVLKQLHLDETLMKAADDLSLDDDLNKSTEEAVGIVGQDIGVPTIVFNNQDGVKTGFFGPVILTLPEMDETVKQWDALVALASSSNFYELKRGRDHSPDVVSTAKC